MGLVGPVLDQEPKRGPEKTGTEGRYFEVSVSRRDSRRWCSRKDGVLETCTLKRGRRERTSDQVKKGVQSQTVKECLQDGLVICSERRRSIVF